MRALRARDGRTSMRLWSRTAAAAALVLSCLAFVHPASADEAEARAHFSRGVTLFDRGAFAEARAAFEEAYREKPSAGIKQNIALCLKAEGDAAAAATAFDEALDEGGASLGAATRAAIERELAELAQSVATVRVTFVDESGWPIPEALVVVDGAPRSLAASRRPIRLAPGLHTFEARATPLAPPPPKRLGLVPGAPTDVAFTFATPRPSAAGQAPPAQPTQPTDPRIVSEPAGAPGAPPPPASFPRRPRSAAQTKRLYLVGALGTHGATYVLSEALHEDPWGRRQDFGGALVAARFGYRLTAVFSLEALLEAGSVTATYVIAGAPLRDPESKATVAHWAALPGLRLTTKGRVRFTTGTALGLRNTWLRADVKVAPTADGPVTTSTIRGSGFGLSWMLDAGLQIDLGTTLFLEGAAFLAVNGHDVDDGAGRALLLDSPTAGGGVRFGLGVSF